MKNLNLDRLTADPFTKARIMANCETIAISGYILDADDKTISLSKDRVGRSYCEYPRSSIVAGFQGAKKSDRITLLIKEDAEVKNISIGKVHDEICNCKEDSGVGVAEARPWKSIHAALAKQMAEMRKILASVGTGPGATYLSCGEGFSDCMRNGGIEEDCRFEEDICIHNGTFG